MCMLHARHLAWDSVCIRYTSPLWQLRVWWRRQVKRQAITRKCFLIFLLTSQLTPQLVFPLLHKFQVHPSLSCDPCFLAVFVDTGVQYSFREKALKSHSGSAEALKRVLSCGPPWWRARRREIWEQKVTCPQNCLRLVERLLKNSQH